MEKTDVKKIAVPDTRKKQSVQRLRFYSQLFSLVLNLWIAVQFYLFVKFLEKGGEGLYMPRPPGVEGWLPISSLVSLRNWWETGIVSSIHPAGLIILVVILLTAFIFKKGFCSWVCPVGFVSEMLGDISDKLWRGRLKLPSWLDWPLRMVKYLLLAFFIYAVFIQMTLQSIKEFIHSDYNQVADILMLRFFTHISLLALIVIAGLFVLSLVVRGFWCRYLCPYGALLGLLGLISPTRIRRKQESCTDCSTCAQVCPAFIRVDKVREVVSDECVGCLACVDNCPADGTLKVHFATSKRSFSKVKWAVMLVVFFWVSLSAFKLWGPWENSINDNEYIRHMPAIMRGEYQHP